MSRLPFVWDYDIDEPTFRAGAQDVGPCRTSACRRWLPASAALPLSAAPDAWRWTNPHGAGDEGVGLWEK